MALTLVLLNTTNGDPLLSLKAMLPRDDDVVSDTIPPLAGILLANDIPVTLGRRANVLLILQPFRMMPKMLLGKFVLANTLVSPKVANGAILDGPKTTVPFVVNVGFVPYTVTRTGQPYVLTLVIMLSGLR